MDRQQLLQHFDTLAETPEAVEKLRKFVLDLAIRGRLVPQNQSDKPASSLLEEIRKQKRTGKNNSTANRAKQTRDLPEFVEPFELPESWE